jgi:pimeloyl-ACP methyl ester carboxylesterase
MSASSSASPVKETILIPDFPYETLNLPDGRTLAYSTHGVSLQDSKLLPIFYFHGTPGSRIEAGIYDELATEHNLHLIGIDRPGYGHSSYQLNRTFLDWPNDVLALADHLGFAQFGIIAVSGGGPYALACLHEIPPTRLKAASIICGASPTKRFGTSGMSLTNKAVGWLASWSTVVASKLFDYFAGTAARDPNKQLLYEGVEKQATGGSGPEVDRKAVEGVMQDARRKTIMVESFREAISPGGDGVAWELWMDVSDWGFELENVVVGGKRLSWWHGALDVNVPMGLAVLAAEKLQGVDFRRKEEEGHISLIYNCYGEVMMELLERL